MSVSPKSSPLGSPRHAARPRLEPLEPRLHLDATAALVGASGGAVAVVGDTLTVTGTAGSDLIRIVPSGQSGVVRVVLNGTARGSFGPVTRIDVAAGAGADAVAVDPRITLPTRIDGEAGGDRLRGGSGPNTLLGGPEGDVLIGRPGRDVLDGGPGRNRVVVAPRLGVVQLGPSASGAALGALAGSYATAPLRVASGPVVLGPADLLRPKLAGLARGVYEGGQPVALTAATAEDAAAMARLLGVPNPIVFPDGVRRLDLVAFRKTDLGDRTAFSSAVVLPRDRVAGTPAGRMAANRAADRAIRSYLEGVFSAIPDVSPPPQVGGPAADLTQLANQYQSSAIFPQQGTGLVMQYNNTVYGARSFTNQEDYYLFIQELAVQNGTDPFQYVGPINAAQYGVFVVDGNTMSAPLLASPTILQPSPQANPGTTSYTTGGSVTVGGSIGYNQAQGVNVSVSASVNITNTQTVSVPPIAIADLSNLATGVTQWAYSFNTPQQTGASSSFIDQWIWRLPFGAYPAGSEGITFLTELIYKTAGNPDQGMFDWGGVVPEPFGATYQLANPVVTAVSTPAVRPGETFTIRGTGLYPSLILNVLIGGKALDPANFTPVSDTEIRVVAPDTPGTALPVTVRTTQGFSNDATITIQG